MPDQIQIDPPSVVYAYRLKHSRYWGFTQRASEVERMQANGNWEIVEFRADEAVNRLSSRVDGQNQTIARQREQLVVRDEAIDQLQSDLADREAMVGRALSKLKQVYTRWMGSTVAQRNWPDIVREIATPKGGNDAADSSAGEPEPTSPDASTPDPPAAESPRSSPYPDRSDGPRGPRSLM